MHDDTRAVLALMRMTIHLIMLTVHGHGHCQLKIEHIKAGDRAAAMSPAIAMTSAGTMQ